MPKSENQKLKLLILKEYLETHSDQNHPVSVDDIIAYLASRDIKAERKTVYSDLHSLEEMGMDIHPVRGKSFGYYVGDRDFELIELKVLVDCIQSSRFITNKKTMTLIKKIEGLASNYQASELQRQVYVLNRVKSSNNQIYYNVDSISTAINNGVKIQFKYYRYKLDKTTELRHDGCLYEMSPFALIYDNENYYLLAYDSDLGKMKHFRVDKMLKITPTSEKRDGIDVFRKIDMSTYNTKVFSMWGGDRKRVTMKMENSLIDPVVDRFGNDVIMMDAGDGCFTATFDAEISPQFYAWVFGFGSQVEILSPADVREGMQNMAKEVLNNYR